MSPPFDEGAFESRLAWIFGSPRTGSTWLLDLLTFPLRHRFDQSSGARIPRPLLARRAIMPHRLSTQPRLLLAQRALAPRRLSAQPAAVPINEPYLAQHLTPILEPHHEAGGGHFLLNTSRADDPNYFFSDAFADSWRPEVRRLVLVRLHAQAELLAREYSLDDPLVVIKEPNGSHGAGFLMSLLPRSRLIFQLRDGRDVVDSMLHAQQAGGWLVDQPGVGPAGDESQRLEFVRRHSLLWVNRIEIVERAYASHPPELRIMTRYEELRDEPVGALRRLVDWLGIERTDSELRAAISAYQFDSLPRRLRGPAKGFRAATPGLWRENTSDTEQRLMSEIMGKTLERLGYAV